MGSVRNMSVAARSRLIASALLAMAAALSACVAVPTPTPGPGAPTIGPKAAFTMRSAPVKGAKASFALARLTGAPEDVVLQDRPLLIAGAAWLLLFALGLAKVHL